jgi:hypothetical protein
VHTKLSFLRKLCYYIYHISNRSNALICEIFSQKLPCDRHAGAWQRDPASPSSSPKDPCPRLCPCLCRRGRRGRRLLEVRASISGDLRRRIGGRVSVTRWWGGSKGGDWGSERQRTTGWARPAAGASWRARRLPTLGIGGQVEGGAVTGEAAHHRPPVVWVGVERG